MSTENQNLDQATRPQSMIMGELSLGKIIGDVLNKRAAQRQDEDSSPDLVSISGASGHGKSDIGLQMETLKSQKENQEKVEMPSFAEFIKALTETELEDNSEIRENEKKGQVEFIPQDFINKKISIKIQVSDLLENTGLNSSLDLFLDAKGVVSFNGDSGLEKTNTPLERANVIVFSTVVDAMKDFYNELGGEN